MIIERICEVAGTGTLRADLERLGQRTGGADSDQLAHAADRACDWAGAPPLPLIGKPNDEILV